jgi:hypothetical protein
MMANQQGVVMNNAVMTKNMMANNSVNMMNANMMNSNMMTYNSCYEGSSPSSLERGRGGVDYMINRTISSNNA